MGNNLSALSDDDEEEPLPAGWQKLEDEDGRAYYQNAIYKCTQRERPTRVEWSGEMAALADLPGQWLPGEQYHPKLELVRRAASEGGWGVIATEPIPAGEILLRTAGASVGGKDMADILGAVGAASDIAEVLRDRISQLHPRLLEEAPLELRQRFASIDRAETARLFPTFSSYSHDDLLLLLMRLELNTFDKGIFPRAAFFNHACKPSAQAFAVDVSEAPAVPMLEVVAIAPIAAGDEITISYLATDGELCLPTDQRRAWLSAYWFECHCSICSGPHTLMEGVLCPNCSAGVCIYDAAADNYVCSVARPGQHPEALCHCRLPSEPADAAVVVAFEKMSAATARQSATGDDVAAELAVVCGALAAVCTTLPIQHWITNLAAISVSRVFSKPAARTLRRSHPLHLLAAEYVRLACSLQALQPLDYAVSNCHERLAECWLAAMHAATDGEKPATCDRLWAACVDPQFAVEGDPATYQKYADLHTKECARIRSTTGWR